MFEMPTMYRASAYSPAFVTGQISSTWSGAVLCLATLRIHSARIKSLAAFVRQGLCLCDRRASGCSLRAIVEI